MTELERKRDTEKAKQIALELDPKAGAFFRQLLISAALAGMAYKEQK